jgi:gliding motility-associated-like protein
MQGGRFDMAPGTYSLAVTDAKGCSAEKTGIVVGSTSSTLKPSLGADVALCPGSAIELSPGAFATYTWQDGSKLPTYTVRAPGLYYVTVANAGGCTATDSINVTLAVNCSGVYFPTVFTPNGDAKNDAFGVIGDISNVKKYTMQVYNRYGERIYFTESAFKKWNGRYLSVLQETGVYTWQSSFEYNGVQYFRKGTILLIR